MTRMVALAYQLLTRVIIRSDPGNHALADATGQDTKGRMSVIADALAALTRLLGTAGVVLSAVLLTSLALLWLVPDRRIERLIKQHTPTP